MGAVQVASEILSLASATSTVPALVIDSRIALNRGEAVEAVALAEQASAIEPTSVAAAMALMAARTFAGDVEGGVRAAERLRESDQTRTIANAYRLGLETSIGGSIEEALRGLPDDRRDGGGLSAARFRAITASNRALLLKARGQAKEALEASDDAIAALAGAATDITEVSARLTHAWALAHLGDVEAAREACDVARRIASPGQRLEVAGEVAELEYYYGDHELARRALDEAERLEGEGRDQALLIKCLLVGARDVSKARAEFSTMVPGLLRTTVAFEARRILTQAYLARRDGSRDAHELALRAAHHAHGQGALLWESYAQVLAAVVADEDPSSVILAVAAHDATVISMAADLVAENVGRLNARALEILDQEAKRRPTRWRPFLRAQLEDDSNRRAAAMLLASVGDRSDVELIHHASRIHRDGGLLGYSRLLSKRVATPVEVLDLGRVRLRRGGQLIDGSSVRRKVLALLCFLVTKPSFSASREDVVESLWPDLDPDDGLNSLNQTAYFLRRVLEPGFQEALTAGFLRQDGETIWMDTELITSKATECLGAISKLPSPPSCEQALSLLDIYEAPFALDFTYEEWASRFRDPLHASVLRVVEQSLREGTAQRRFGPATQLAERALRLDPESDDLQVTLIGLYRANGAQAAAAERYAIYAASLRSMGLEVPTLEEVGTARG
jgi:DNA-binding SARP family transcriptional activator